MPLCITTLFFHLLSGPYPFSHFQDLYTLLLLATIPCVLHLQSTSILDHCCLIYYSIKKKNSCPLSFVISLFLFLENLKELFVLNIRLHNTTITIHIVKLTGNCSLYRLFSM